MTTTTTDYAEFKARKEEARQVNSARVRCWGVALGHFFLPPVASVAYAVKTGKWAPTLFATGAAVVATPIAAVDLGITLAVVPPLTSAVMIINQVKDDRRRQQFISPEEADMAAFAKGF